LNPQYRPISAFYKRPQQTKLALQDGQTDASRASYRSAPGSYVRAWIDLCLGAVHGMAQSLASFACQGPKAWPLMHACESGTCSLAAASFLFLFFSFCFSI
jgi:hypothetical protein